MERVLKCLQHNLILIYSKTPLVTKLLTQWSWRCNQLHSFCFSKQNKSLKLERHRQLLDESKVRQWRPLYSLVIDWSTLPTSEDLWRLFQWIKQAIRKRFTNTKVSITNDQRPDTTSCIIDWFVPSLTKPWMEIALPTGFSAILFILSYLP